MSTSTSTHPCALCSDQTKRNEDDARLGFDFTPEELQRSAYLTGCESCLVILEGLRQSKTRGWALSDIRRVYARCCGVRNGGFRDTLQLEIYFRDDRVKLEVEFYSLQPHAFKGILPRNRTSGHPLSPRALDWILGALEQCKTGHESCQKTIQPFLPKRVLALGTSLFGGITVRLVETSRDSSAYVALSHCWGSEQTCITTKENIADRKRGIKWASIPKTFQESMTLALKLGFRYIWIDSLCIIQNDEADWEVESSHMWEIYQDAVLTIAATASTGDNEGCCLLNNRLPDLEVELPQDIGTCSIAVRQPHKHFNMNMETSNKKKKHFPLLTRGWAFQERLLSPRVLHLSESELVWECRESSLCECGGIGQARSPGGDYYHAVQENEEEKRVHDLNQQDRHDREAKVDRLWSKDPSRPPAYEEAVFARETRPASSGSDSSVEVDPVAFLSSTNVPLYEDPATFEPNDVKSCPNLVFHFHRVVEAYSGLQLTRATDRLPALSGLCKRVQHLRNNYLAGLWSDSICFDLLWRVETINLNTPTAGARATEYRGPTWSWISVDSPVKYWSNIINFRITYEGFPVLNRSASGDTMSYGFSAPQYTAAGQHAENISMSVTVPGKNPFGSVTSALITIEASCTHVTLRYTYDPHTYGGTGEHNPVRYKLELPYTPEHIDGVFDEQQPIDIPFWPDYSLSAEGDSKVPEDTQLTLLLIHPEVSLVLRPRKGRGKKKWERVGVARISEALLNYYRVDWMKGSEVKRFHIL